MNPAEFDRLVAAAYARIPARFRRRLKNIALVVEPEPAPEQLARGRIPRGSTLLGLYEGRPFASRCRPLGDGAARSCPWRVWSLACASFSCSSRALRPR